MDQNTIQQVFKYVIYKIFTRAPAHLSILVLKKPFTVMKIRFSEVGQIRLGFLQPCISLGEICFLSLPLSVGAPLWRGASYCDVRCADANNALIHLPRNLK